MEQLLLTENGRKNTAAKQLSFMAASCGYHISESYLKNGAPNQEAWTPIVIRAHIQLAGDDLANNHTFKLLSGLLVQTLHKKNIALTISPVNPKSSFRKKFEPGLLPAHSRNLNLLIPGASMLLVVKPNCKYHRCNQSKDKNPIYFYDKER